MEQEKKPVSLETEHPDKMLALLKNYSLLYVDDVPEIREMQKKSLGKHFKIFLTGSNGEEGLEIYHNSKPDLIIADLNMPVMNGLDMAHAIRQTDTRTPIILLTAYTGMELVTSASREGIIHYLVKPVPSADLLDSIFRCLGLKGR